MNSNAFGGTNRLLAGAILCVVAVCTADRTLAAEFRSDETVTIEADETIDDDLYFGGRTLTIDGSVYGDVYAAGEKITVNGTIEGNLLAAGGEIVITGAVEDGAHIAGSVLKLEDGARLGGDLFAACKSFEAKQGSTVAGELYVGGDQALLSGQVDKKVFCAVTKGCQLSGSFENDVDLAIGGQEPFPNFWSPPLPIPAVPLGLTIDKTAVIRGDLHYRSRQQGAIAEGAQIDGESTWDEIKVEEPTASNIALEHARRMAGLLIVGLAMILLLPSWSLRLADNVRMRPIASFFLGLFAVPLLAVILVGILFAMILLGVLFGLATLTDMVAFVIVMGSLSLVGLTGGFLVYSLYLGNVVVSLAVGRAIMRRAANSRSRFLPLLIGLVLLAALSAIPYAGSIVLLLVWIMGAGGLCLWIFFSPRPRSDASSAASAGS